MFFWNSLAFSTIQRMLAIWSLVPLPFLKPAWTSGSSLFTYCWRFPQKNFEHYFASMWDECNCVVFWAFFAIGMKTDLFHFCGHCWVFQICWHNECSTLTASSFRIWKNSTGNPSPPLALFVLDSILKSRDITLPTKVCLVKAKVFQWSCMDVRIGLWRKLSAEELMLLNCGVGEDA